MCVIYAYRSRSIIIINGKHCIEPFGHDRRKHHDFIICLHDYIVHQSIIINVKHRFELYGHDDRIYTV